MGRLLRVAPLCYEPPVSAAVPKAVGLSPYPYYFLERTKTTVAKTEILKFRVTPEEKEIIVRKALSSYKLVSRYLSKAIEYVNVCIKNIPSMKVAESEQKKLNSF